MRLIWPLAFGLSGALLVGGASLLLPDRYTSTSVLRIDVEPFPAADVINGAWQETVSRQTLKRLIERLNLYPEERDRLPLEDVMENAKKDDIALDVPLEHDVLLTFAYRDPATAKIVATALIDAMVAESEDRARAEPGWGRLEVTQPVAVECASSGLAFWKPSRYMARGSLAVRKLDDFKVDRQATEQRAQALRTKAFIQLRYSVESYESVEELNRHLRVDLRANVLILKLTEADPRRAQLINSRVANGLMDDNRHIPDCGAPRPDAPPVSRSIKSMDATPQRLPSGLIPDSAPQSPTVTPSHSLLASNGPLFPDAAFGWTPPGNGAHPITIGNDCRDPNTPDWESTITILDPATLPDVPDGPSRPILSVFGFFLGLGLCVALRGR